VGLPGLDNKNPTAAQEIIVEGRIAVQLRPDGRRQFTGDNLGGYWTDRGSSGSPVFLKTGMQLAGILSLSETGAKSGRSPIHEAFVVPATTIRTHVERLTTTSVAQHVPIAELQPVRDAPRIQPDTPLADLAGRLTEFIIAARARAADRVGILAARIVSRLRFGGAAAVFVVVFWLLSHHTTEIRDGIDRVRQWVPEASANPPAHDCDVPPENSGKVVRMHAEKSPFRVDDRLDVRIEVLRPSRLFCFLLHQTCEATLLYPAYPGQENSFSRSKAEMKFPDDFKTYVTLDPYRAPVVEFFHCIATEEPLRDELEKWFKNTAALRLEEKRSLSVASVEAGEILSELRKSEGYDEAWTKIEVVPK
jgi:hypothetical protein